MRNFEINDDKLIIKNESASEVRFFIKAKDKTASKALKTSVKALDKWLAERTNNN